MHHIRRVRDRQLVASRQREYQTALVCRYCFVAVLHRVRRRRQLAPVVHLAAVRGFDRQRLAALRHRQSAVHCRDQVVAHRGRRARRHLYAVDRRDHVRLRADVRDRALRGHHDRELVCIAFGQACHRELRLRQSAAVVVLARILRGDRYGLRLDLQPAVRHLQVFSRVKGIVTGFNGELVIRQTHRVAGIRVHVRALRSRLAFTSVGHHYALRQRIRACNLCPVRITSEHII